MCISIIYFDARSKYTGPALRLELHGPRLGPSQNTLGTSKVDPKPDPKIKWV